MPKPSALTKLNQEDFTLLQTLCELYGPSGDEGLVRDFIVEYVKSHQHTWICKPKLLFGNGFQNNVMLVFGKPRTAVFAHMDSIGYTHRYNRELVKIGSPQAESGTKLWGLQNGKRVSGLLYTNPRSNTLQLETSDSLLPGTAFVYDATFKLLKHEINSCYLDNRLGVFIALQLAQTLRDGILVFSTWEEHGGGSVSYLQRYIAETYRISQALIADISWISEGVRPGKGAVISMRDRWIPRQDYVRKLIKIADQSGIPYQLEVEDAGGSDASELQMAENPWDWCFVGAPESGVHTPNERVHLNDVQSMRDLYRLFLEKL